MRMISDIEINCRPGEKQDQGYPPVWLKENNSVFGCPELEIHEIGDPWMTGGKSRD